jgi:hypothetical protein
VVMLNVGLVDTGQSPAGVLPEETQQAGETVLDGIHILAENPDFLDGSARKVRMEVSTELSILMKAMRRSKAVSR